MCNDPIVTPLLTWEVASDIFSFAARSPVFSHVAASLDGITTIRASGAQFLLQKEFDIHQDLHTRSWFIIIGTSCAFGFLLDVISVLFLAIVTYSFLLADDGT